MANCFPAIACADYRYSIGYYFTFSTLPEQKIFVLSGTMVGQGILLFTVYKSEANWPRKTERSTILRYRV